MSLTFDAAAYLGAVDRSVTTLERDGRTAHAVTLSRSYDTTVDDLWDALTSAERLPRWFLPVTGDLRQGGRYQLKGNAGGTITRCSAPTRLDLTWEFSGQMSWVEVRLTSEGRERTRLTLAHIAHADDHWNKYGPGAAGVGWELGLVALSTHLTDPSTRITEEEFHASPEAGALLTGSARAWGEAHLASGVDPAAARLSARRTVAFYTGQPEPES